MGRAGTAGLSDAGEAALAAFGETLHRQHDLRPATLRNYLADVRHFIAWCEATWREADAAAVFTTATINCRLVSLKRSTAWAHAQWSDCRRSGQAGEVPAARPAAASAHGPQRRRRGRMTGAFAKILILVPPAVGTALPRVVEPGLPTPEQPGRADSVPMACRVAQPIGDGGRVRLLEFGRLRRDSVRLFYF